MPAKDRLHDTVVRAGWNTEEQPRILIGERFVWVDLRATNAEQDLIILIEIKGFEVPSQIDALASAMGKYVLYRAILEYTDDPTPLYLAVPVAVYEGILSEAAGEYVLRREEVKLIVFDPDRKEIVQWIP